MIDLAQSKEAVRLKSPQNSQEHVSLSPCNCDALARVLTLNMLHGEMVTNWEIYCIHLLQE